ncbi:MAG: lysozyme [Alphaproteobacteria bacterium]|mgnify:FL=1|jgi:lysozyme|nr:lysozyme [Alphaproteobacteria bacterium]MBT5390629.1 lysozyme [Alphaproteobacteria bacterium]MBT5540777.1 lysozyme [Alphaproteobacteria bacterium]
MNRLSAQGLQFIKSFEGFSAVPYHCPGGYWTIGYGHVIIKTDSFDESITTAEAQSLLYSDIKQTEKGVQRLVHVSLSQKQFDALVSLTFNVGAGALQRSTLRRVLNGEEHGLVPQELLKWIWAGGRRHRGLLKRRKLEGDLYRGLL